MKHDKIRRVVIGLLLAVLRGKQLLSGRRIHIDRSENTRKTQLLVLAEIVFLSLLAVPQGRTVAAISNDVNIPA